MYYFYFIFTLALSDQTIKVLRSSCYNKNAHILGHKPTTSNTDTEKDV